MYQMETIPKSYEHLYRTVSLSQYFSQCAVNESATESAKTDLIFISEAS